MAALDLHRSKLSLLALACAAGIAGCGGGDEPTGGGGDADVDAAALLRDGMLNINKDGKPIEQGAFTFIIDGKVDAPKDEELRALDGKVKLDVALDAKPEGESATSVPPFALGVTVDGSYTNAKDQEKPGKYAAGVSFIDNKFYAKWDGTDYAVGEQLSEQLLAEIEKAEQEAGGGAAGTTPDTRQILDAMDLQPETWVTDPKAEDGGTLDGVETWKVSGDVAVKPMLTDLVDGMRNLPKALPKGSGVDSLSKIEDISEEDFKQIEEALTEAKLAVWVGKEDKLQRRMLVDVAAKDDDAEEPVELDLSIDVASSKLGQPQNLKAPAQAEPITDLFLKLEKEFGGLLGQLTGGQSAAPVRG